MKNDESTGMLFTLLLIATIASFVVKILLALLIFVAILVTIIALIAIPNGLKFGDVSISREDGIGFIVRGIFASALISAFAAFAAAVFDYQIPEESWGWIGYGGYAVGSLFLTAAVAAQQEQQAKQEPEEASVVLRQLPPAPREVPSADQNIDESGEPYQYAIWDDEDEFK